jgi:hypothetical protein
MALKEIKKIEADETTSKMIQEQLESMPLRSMPMFSNDKFSYKRVCGLVKLLNNDISGIFKFL